MSIITRPGVLLPQNKEETLAVPPLLPPVPLKVSVPLCLMRGEAMLVLVSPGDEVAAGDLLAEPEREGASPVYSPFAGKVTGHAKIRVPGVGRLPCLQMDVGAAAVLPGAVEMRAHFALDELIALAAQASIVDESDSLRLADKLSAARARDVKMICCDALDEEPYVCSGIATLLASTGEVVFAAQLLSALFGGARAFAAVSAAGPLRERLRVAVGGQIELFLPPGAYPARPKLDARINAAGGGLTVGAQALLALARATAGVRTYTTLLTVTDVEQNKSVNTHAYFGAPVGALLEALGFPAGDKRIVSGGPMRGRVIDADTPVVPGMSAVTLLPADDEDEVPCIGCGRCAAICPVGLIPEYCMPALERRDAHELAFWRAGRCIGCGCCTYVCPSRIAVTHRMLVCAHLLAGKGGRV